jgi:hypothetical protein
VLWSGGPGASVSKEVRGGQSYYCIYGKEPATSIDAVNIRKAIDPRNASDTANITSAFTACGNYGAVPPNEPENLFTAYANGHYENAERNSIMAWFTNWGCGFCIVFK